MHDYGVGFGHDVRDRSDEDLRINGVDGRLTARQCQPVVIGVRRSNTVGRIIPGRDVVRGFGVGGGGATDGDRAGCLGLDGGR